MSRTANREDGPSGARVLPRTRLEEWRIEALRGLTELFVEVGSPEAMAREEAERSGLSPLQSAVLNAQFVFRRIDPLVRRTLRRGHVETVGMTEHTRSADGSAYDVDFGGAIWIGNLNMIESSTSVDAITHQMRWVLSSRDKATRQGGIEFGAQRRVDLLSPFIGELQRELNIAR